MTMLPALVAETTTAGNNPTGQVTGGYLHLLVLFANATWERGKYGMELVGISKPGVEKVDVRRNPSMRLPGGMKFDVDTNCEKVIKTPIVCMECSAPIEGTRHSHGLAPSLYGFVLEDSDEGTF
jgi:hypothetical protein